ncbi:MFS transporter [Phenylobacterium sp.]|uniref:MFS transporter n=1 Tax=Phenylobacterium sp. TaxID=1871053 RepID=UPI0035ADA065
MKVDAHSAPAWIGARPTLAQSAAVLAIGVVGVMIAGLQPLLLGELQHEARLTASQIGHAATAELMTMGLTLALAGAWLAPERLRLITAAAGAALAAANLATLQVSGEMITLVRGVAGAPEGLLVWVTINLITRAPRPERWSGLFLTLQTLAQLAMASLLTAFVVGRYGANGGFMALAGLGVVAAACSLAVPGRFLRLPRAEEGGLSPPAGWAALGACFLFLAFIVGVWVYAEPLSRQAGHAPAVAGTAVSISLACQVLGGTAATLLAGRVRWFWAVVVCGVADLGLLAVFASLPPPVLFLAGCGAFGFLWLFVLPFFAPMAIEADPSRRAAVLLGGAQLLGSSLGPLFASFLVSDAETRGALGFGAVCLILAMGLMAGLHLRHGRAARI